LDTVFWDDVRRLGIEVHRQDFAGAVTLDFGPEGLKVVPFLKEK